MVTDTDRSKEFAHARMHGRYSAKLQCRGRVKGQLIVTGGPNLPDQCGGFQEGGVVSFSADGKHWWPAASWSCNTEWCDTEGVEHAISADHDSSMLTVEFPEYSDVQFVELFSL
jgi:hypothetical protein